MCLLLFLSSVFYHGSEHTTNIEPHPTLPHHTIIYTYWEFLLNRSDDIHLEVDRMENHR
jgi:hypothetical protein